MKRRLSVNAHKLILIAIVVSLLAALIYVVLRSGPLAPVPVTVITVTRGSLSPSLFGIGTVEARYTHRIGPTFAGRVVNVRVDVGDTVQAGQLLAEMEPVDLDQRIAAQSAAGRRAEAGVMTADALQREAAARHEFAATQLRRYEMLQTEGVVSAEAVDATRRDLGVAAAALAATRANREASRQETLRFRDDREALVRQRENLRLIAPIAGLVTSRLAEPGTVLVAGQAVIEIVDPRSFWINTRFEQSSGAGLREGLSASVVLRSSGVGPRTGKVVRVEPRADAVTEEILAKVILDPMPVANGEPVADGEPEPLPLLSDLAEVTVILPALPEGPVVPEACLHQVDGRLGVWLINDSGLRFVPVRAGAASLEGDVRILDGIKEGDRIVVYSLRRLEAGSRIKIVESLTGS